MVPGVPLENYFVKRFSKETIIKKREKKLFTMVRNG